MRIFLHASPRPASAGEGTAGEGGQGQEYPVLGAGRGSKAKQNEVRDKISGKSGWKRTPGRESSACGCGTAGLAVASAGRGGIPTLFWQSPAAHPPLQEWGGCSGDLGSFEAWQAGKCRQNPCGKLLRTDPALASG